MLALVQEVRFVSRFALARPSEWQQAGSRARWLTPEQGELNYAGVQWYVILLGEYRQLQDASLRRLGALARASLFGVLVLLAALIVCLAATEAVPSLACLSQLWH